jgi:uncharacterized protein YjlB
MRHTILGRCRFGQEVGVPDLADPARDNYRSAVRHFVGDKKQQEEWTETWRDLLFRFHLYDKRVKRLEVRDAVDGANLKEVKNCSHFGLA